MAILILYALYLYYIICFITYSNIESLTYVPVLTLKETISLCQIIWIIYCIEIVVRLNESTYWLFTCRLFVNILDEFVIAIEAYYRNHLWK